MSTQNFTNTTSRPSAVDLSALTSGYRFAALNGAGEAALCGAGARPYAMFDNDGAKVGQQTRLEGLGGRKGAKIEAGATIAAQANVGSDATGRLVPITVSGQWVCGTADEAGVVNQIVAFTPCEPYRLP